jgi:hypothetical protein
MGCCSECGAKWVKIGETSETSVGYFSPPGHDHNDNCLVRGYVCANGHVTRVSKRRSCPACEWKGRTSCHCHYGTKVDKWPEVA